MDRTAVESSNLQSIGYDTDEETLEIEFKNKSVYQYYNVPLSLYLDLIDSESKGGFLSKKIKNAGYRYRKIM